MALGINTNVASLTAQNQLNNSQKLNDQALERLSSGLRINSAKDDAAGLAISTRFQAQISGLNVAQRNANDGISYAQTAEGALGEITNALTRIRDLAVQSANATNSSSDRAALDQEVTALKDEVERISQSTQFNGQNILDGTLSDLTFQVGANQGQTISVSGVDSRSTQLGSTTLEGTAVKDASFPPTNISIEGKTIDLSNAASLDDVVDAINKNTGVTDVSAQRQTSLTQDFSFAALTTSNGTTVDIKINDETITVTESDNINSLAKKIEDSGEGVTAEVVGGEIRLTTLDQELEITSADSGAGAFILGTSGGTADASGKYEAGITLVSKVSNSDFSVDGAGTGEVALGLTTSEQTNKVSELSVSDDVKAANAITTVDQALDQINGLRAELGAVQSRFESTISNLASTSENLSAANSRILDADFAAETAKLAKSQVLQQAGISVLAQANARPQQVLSLLQ
ncbi:flagellin [Marinobacter manganoxydans]|uniref:Flagellin n=1 Tax=Marinobacter manganoxydans MnI7-9 TaxID=1094979 RepID=G6YQV5_9GAMM|nr:flagellin [Marinobacter manganoxydans]EHJ05412.1 flagellin domain-containing protein [Marinobacter manganoxydans MnI7-9]